MVRLNQLPLFPKKRKISVGLLCVLDVFVCCVVYCVCVCVFVCVCVCVCVMSGVMSASEHG